MININSIPRDVLLHHLFDKLDSKSLCLAGGVCRTWRKLKNDAFFQQLRPIFGNIHSYLKLEKMDVAEMYARGASITYSDQPQPLIYVRYYLTTAGFGPGETVSAYFRFSVSQGEWVVEDTLSGTAALPRAKIFEPHIQAWHKKLIAGETCNGFTDDYQTENIFLIYEKA